MGKVKRGLEYKRMQFCFSYLACAHVESCDIYCMSSDSCIASRGDQSYSLVHTCEPNGLQTKCVYGWRGLRTCGAPPKRLPQTKICWSFTRTQREFGVLDILCSSQVCRKLIYHAPSTNCL